MYRSGTRFAASEPALWSRVCFTSEHGNCRKTRTHTDSSRFLGLFREGTSTCLDATRAFRRAHSRLAHAERPASSPHTPCCLTVSWLRRRWNTQSASQRNAWRNSWRNFQSKPAIRWRRPLNWAPLPPPLWRSQNGEKCDLIVMGTHGRTGWSRVLLGSTAEGVLRPRRARYSRSKRRDSSQDRRPTRKFCSTQPTAAKTLPMTLPAISPPPVAPARIIVGVDYDETCRAATLHALALGCLFNVRASVARKRVALHGPCREFRDATNRSDGSPFDTRPSARRNSSHGGVRELVGVARPHCLSVESGDPKQVLLDFVHKDLGSWLVLGARKHSAVSEWFLGSTAGYVVRHCQVPVLVVPPLSTWP